MRMMRIRKNDACLEQISFVLLNEEWAQRNHGQSLARLADRGGLIISEAAAIMERRPWREMSDSEAMSVVVRVGTEFLKKPDAEVEVRGY